MQAILAKHNIKSRQGQTSMPSLSRSDLDVHVGLHAAGDQWRVLHADKTSSHTQNNYSHQQLATYVVDARNTFLSYLLQQSLGKSISRPVEIFKVLVLMENRVNLGRRTSLDGDQETHTEEVGWSDQVCLMSPNGFFSRVLVSLSLSCLVKIVVLPR